MHKAWNVLHARQAGHLFLYLNLSLGAGGSHTAIIWFHVGTAFFLVLEQLLLVWDQWAQCWLFAFDLPQLILYPNKRPQETSEHLQQRHYQHKPLHVPQIRVEFICP